MSKRIVVLGGSYAGVKAAKTLHKAFKKDENVEITLIDRHNFHTLMTELHEVAGHRTEPDSIKIDLFKIFAGRKVNVIVDNITDFNFEKKELKSKNNTYSYDYLIMGMGNEPNFFGIEGAAEYAHTLWSYENAVSLREHIEKMFEKAAAEKNTDERKKLLTFAVCGGGFTGVEMVGELGEAKVHLAKKYHIDVKEVTILNIEAMGRILNMLKDENQVKKVEKRYKKLGIELLVNSAICKIDADSFTLKDGRVIPTYTLIWTAGIQNNTAITKLGFDLGKCGEYPFESGRCGRIVVNEYMQPIKDGNVVPGIFVVGDSAAYQDEDGPLPQIVEAAEQSGHTAAENVIALIKGEELHKHKQNYHGFMVSVGSRYAVAETGFNTSGFFAQLIKHFVNFYYQFMVSGIRQLWSYMRHEFFHVKNRRSIVGAHFATASKNIWKFPLRLWLGYMWLVEGVAKIGEGWLEKPMVINTVNALAGFTPATDGGTSATGAAAETVAETTTAATGAAGGGGAEVVAEQLHPIFQWAIDHKPSGYGESLMHAPKFIVDMMNNYMASYEVQVQTVMVILEILIGLSLLAGLFTFISTIMSVGIGFGIIMTGMADATMIWYIVSAIALIQGAGAALGLDYYVIPVLKRWWSKTGIARKSYLYFDYFEES
ncbi:MAG: NAD(P)/FAD-dependent oxidoreductase [Eubacteriales bacterium]